MQPLLFYISCAYFFYYKTIFHLILFRIKMTWLFIFSVLYEYVFYI